MRRSGRSAQTAAAETAITINRGLGLRTECEIALRIPDNGTQPEPGETVHDFREEEKILHRVGRVFRSIRIPAEYLPAHLLGPLTDEIAEQYVGQAKKFFSVQISLAANPKSLYEDAESAFIVSLFRAADRRCYYVLNEMRKTINDNARRLVLVLTFILLAWTIAAMFEFDFVVNAVGSAAAAPKKDAVTVEMVLQNSFFWSIIVLGALWSALIIVTFLIQNNGYRQQQQHNIRELRFFLTKYLGRIADRYRESTGNAKQVTVGDETDSHKLSASAQRWHKIMVWIPFRTFFIESFVRSIRYQISRNCSYYLWIPPASIVLLILIVLYHTVLPALLLPETTIGSTTFLLNAAIVAMMLGIFVFIYFERIHSVVLAEELSHLDWLGYDNLNVSSAMDEVVGKYAEEVGFWKERFKL